MQNGKTSLSFRNVVRNLLAPWNKIRDFEAKRIPSGFKCLYTASCTVVSHTPHTTQETTPIFNHYTHQSHRDDIFVARGKTPWKVNHHQNSVGVASLKVKVKNKVTCIYQRPSAQSAYCKAISVLLKIQSACYYYYQCAIPS